MIETIYNVTTNYTLRDGAKTPLDSIAKAAVGAAAALGLVVSAQTAWNQLVAGPQEIPTSVVTMASLINANQTYVDTAGKAVSAAANFGQSQADAKTMVDQMTQASKTSAGSLQDFIGIGVDTLNAFTQSGGNLGAPFVAFDKQVLTTASLLQEDFKQAGMDAMRILSGGAGLDVRLFAAIRPQIFALSKDLSKLPIDKATEKFNKMAAPERLKLFQKAMSKFATPEAVGAITGTLPAQLSTLTDNVVAARNAFAGAFSDRALASLVRINAWFERNGSAIEATAKRWGSALAFAFDKGVQGVQFIGDHLGIILPIVAAVAGTGAVAFGKWLFHLGPVAKTVTGLLSPLKGVTDYVKGSVETFAMFRTMGAGLGQSLWGALTFGVSPITLGIVAMGLFLGYVAASPARIQAMADAFAPVTAAVDLARESMALTGGYIMAVLTPVMNAAGFAGSTAFGWVTQAIQYTTMGLVLAVAGVQIFAISVRGAVEKAVSLFQFLRDVIVDVTTALSTFSLSAILKNPGAALNTIKGAATGQLKALSARNAGIDLAIGSEKAAVGDETVAALSKAFGTAGNRGKGKAASAGGRGAPVAQSHTTNIHGGVKIIMDVKDNAEPDRIAFGVKDLFDKAARNPTAAKSAARMGLA